jgi:hypothetical protein
MAVGERLRSPFKGGAPMAETQAMLEDLATLPFAEVFRRVSADQRSGDLQVRAARVAKTVFFDRGALVFAASNLKKDRLGEALVAVGRISERQFDHATALMRSRDRRRRIGEALQESGLLDEKEVGRAVAMQVQRIVLSLFAQTDGVASFEERPCVIPPEYMVSLSVHGLLYRGIKSMRNPALIRIGIGELERKVVMVPVPPFRFSAERASQEEKEVLECAQTPARLSKLVTSEGRIVSVRLRAAYALLASGVLRLAEPSGEDTQPVVHVDDRDFVLVSREPEIGLELFPLSAADEVETPHAGSPEAAASSPRSAPEGSPVVTGAGALAEEERQRQADEQGVIGELLNQAKLHAAIKNTPEILKIYAKLIEIAPGHAGFRLQLARALASLPQTIKRAERQFLEAVRLDPRDPEIRYAFGVYYDRMKHKGRAREQLRLALSLNPRHERAHAALEALAPKDSALDSLKKLFR